jgi:hypothetical protein
MRIWISLLCGMSAAITALATCSIGSSAKVFDMQHVPRNIQLQNADSFSVECRNDRTGVIDRESVDVDAATVTVEIPGSAPVVHRISQFAVNGSQVQDRFGQIGMELHLEVANWGTLATPASAYTCLTTAGCPITKTILGGHAPIEQQWPQRLGAIGHWRLADRLRTSVHRSREAMV